MGQGYPYVYKYWFDKTCDFLKKNNMRIPKIINYDSSKDPKRSWEEPLMRIIESLEKRNKSDDNVQFVV